MKEGVYRNARPEKKKEFSMMLENTMMFIEMFKNSDDGNRTLYANRLARRLRESLPRYTSLYNDVSKVEPHFVIKHNFNPIQPELVVSTTMIIVFSTIVKAIQPLVDFEIADISFKELEVICWQEVENFDFK